MSWQLLDVLAWFTYAIPRICGCRRRKDNTFNEENVESGSRNPSHRDGDLFDNPSKEQIKPTIEELQASIQYV